MIFNTNSRTSSELLMAEDPIKEKYYAFPSLKANWSSFEAGMSGLIQFAEQKSLNSASTASSNIRLLHRDLMGDFQYRKMINSIDDFVKENESYTSINLRNSHFIKVELISMKKNSSFQLFQKAEKYEYFFVISGKIKFDFNAGRFGLINKRKKSNPWWKFNRSLSSDKTLNKDDLFVLQNSEVCNGNFSTMSDNCTILHLSLKMPLNNRNTLPQSHLTPEKLKHIA